ncbi:glycosyltransferase [Microbacterium laevaniformans]|uniref:glycosyltransferase n=1 Tax=Microbacterium laevaniformans TaxID=36807 RepID=UPI0012FAF7B3|nr:glycosyltransferase [Microbacterium laevaniformans]
MTIDAKLVEEERQSWFDSSKTAPRVWVGVVGGVGRRKNVDLVARALEALGPNYGLVLAGAAEGDESEIFEWTAGAVANGTSLIRIPGSIPNARFDAIIRALDCVVIAHSNEGPSGVFAKALSAGVPVVSAGARSLRRDADRAGERASWVPLEATRIAGAIELQSTLAKLPPRSDSVEMFTRRILGGRQPSATSGAGGSTSATVSEC